MSTKEGLSRIAALFRIASAVWFGGFAVSAATHAWGDLRELSVDEQASMYEGQTGQKLNDVAQRLVASEATTDADRLFAQRFGLAALDQAKEHVLKDYFKGKPPQARAPNWGAAVLLLCLGGAGLAIGWGIGWVVSGFAK